MVRVVALLLAVIGAWLGLLDPASATGWGQSGRSDPVERDSKSIGDSISMLEYLRFRSPRSLISGAV